MADKRKLQTEIDRCLKQVAERVEIFNEIWDKFHNAANSNQKDKYEGDLKKEIKKLQRLRDQIKTWLTSGDVKTQRETLLETRKLIEKQMERFKVVERETKTKAYSKEGLAARSDPVDKERQKARKWLNKCIDELGVQMDLLEAEEETLTKKKKKKQPDSVVQRLRELDEALESHKFHVSKLEMIMRLLDNGTLEANQIEDLQEDVEFYISDNQDPDFVANDYMYEDFDEMVTAASQDDTVLAAAAAQLEKDKHESDAAAQKKEPEAVKPVVSSAPVPSTSVVQKSPASTNSAPSKESSPKKQEPKKEKVAASPKNKKGAAAISSPSSTKTAPKGIANFAAAASASTPQDVKPSEVVVEKEAPKLQPQAQVQQAQVQPQAPKVEIVAKDTSSNAPQANGDSLLVTPDQGALNNVTQQGFQNTVPTPLQAPLQTPMHLPVMRGVNSLPVKIRLHQLECGYRTLPESPDMERQQRSYTPRKPCRTPNYYPQQPSLIFDRPNVYSEFDTDTLFFIFYYMQGTLQQYLAARELKKQAWRFHKKYLTWFQRHEEPKAITEEYEQGTYIYFDFEQGWCQRKKTDFTFEYRYLEDQDLP